MNRKGRYHNSPLKVPIRAVPRPPMRPRKYTDEELEALPSKTEIKAAMHALADLGLELTELSPGQLKRINLPDDLLAAVLDYQKMPSHGAKRRQQQYIGKLMRGVDEEPIRAGLALLRGESAAENARFHRLERLRERLLDDESVIQEIATTWPGADVQQLRQLRRNALKERELNKPPKNFRAIFQSLRALEESGRSPEPEESDHGDE